MQTEQKTAQTTLLPSRSRYHATVNARKKPHEMLSSPQENDIDAECVNIGVLKCWRQGIRFYVYQVAKME